jgi:hypothetical protein
MREVLTQYPHNVRHIVFEHLCARGYRIVRHDCLPTTALDDGSSHARCRDTLRTTV